MNEEALRDHYGFLYRFIQRERRMRERVLRGQDRERKLTECDKALGHLVAMKDALKAQIKMEPIQPMLLAVPDRMKYE